jgi:hypothetical protein
VTPPHPYFLQDAPVGIPLGPPDAPGGVGGGERLRILAAIAQGRCEHQERGDLCRQEALGAQ